MTTVDIGGRVFEWKPELHPRDKHGRFRDAWRIAGKGAAALDRMLRTIRPATWGSDAEARGSLSQTQRRQRPRTTEQDAALKKFFTRKGNWDIQSALRGELDLKKAGGPEPTDIKNLDDAMRPTEQDMILTHTSGFSPFGTTAQLPDEVDEWTGKLISDKGYFATSAQYKQMPGNPGDPPHVTWSLLVPRGTRAIIRGGGSDSVIIDREQPIRIIKVSDDGHGGKYIHAAVMPRQGGGEVPRGLGRGLAEHEKSPAIEATPEELARRGLDANGNPIETGPKALTGVPAGEQPALPPSKPGQAPVGAPSTTKPTQEIAAAGGEVPRGAGRVNRPGEAGAPGGPAPAERGGRQVLPEEKARAAEIARREAEVAKREQRVADAQARLADHQARVADQQAKTIDQQSQLIDRLQGQAPAAPQRPTITRPSSEGGTRAAGLTEDQKQSILNRVHKGPPRTEEDVRQQRLANEIAAERGQSPMFPNVEEQAAALGVPAPAKKTARAKKAVPEAAPTEAAPAPVKKAVKRAAPAAPQEKPAEAAPATPAAKKAVPEAPKEKAAPEAPKERVPKEAAPRPTREAPPERTPAEMEALRKEGARRAAEREAARTGRAPVSEHDQRILDRARELRREGTPEGQLSPEDRKTLEDARAIRARSQGEQKARIEALLGQPQQPPTGEHRKPAEPETIKRLLEQTRAPEAPTSSKRQPTHEERAKIEEEAQKIMDRGGPVTTEEDKVVARAKGFKDLERKMNERARAQEAERKAQIKPEEQRRQAKEKAFLEGKMPQNLQDSANRMDGIADLLKQEGASDQDAKALREAGMRLRRGEPVAHIKEDLQTRADYLRHKSEVNDEEVNPGGAARYARQADLYDGAIKAIGRRGPAAGKISAADLGPGDKVLISKHPDGKWVPSTKKTGATPITVTRISTIGSGKSQRLVIHGRDAKGNEVEVHAARGKGGMTGSQRFFVHTEKKKPEAVGEGGIPRLAADRRKMAQERGIPGAAKMKTAELEQAIRADMEREKAAGPKAPAEKPTITKAPPNLVKLPEEQRPVKVTKAAKKAAPAAPEAAPVRKAAKKAAPAPRKTTARPTAPSPAKKMTARPTKAAPGGPPAAGESTEGKTIPQLKHIAMQESIDLPRNGLKKDIVARIEAVRAERTATPRKRVSAAQPRLGERQAKKGISKLAQKIRERRRGKGQPILERIRQGSPTTGPTTPAKRTVQSLDMLAHGDTSRSGIQIEDVDMRVLGMEEAYRIKHATVFRHDGVTIVAEHDGTFSGRRKARKAAREIAKYHASLTPDERKVQHAYALHLGRDPEEKQWMEQFGLNPEEYASEASAGLGEVHLWQVGKRPVTREVLSHEMGHNAEGAAPVHLRSSGQRWQSSAVRDTSYAASISSFQQTYEADDPLHQIRFQPDHHADFPHGVTEYGTKSPGEDFAEARALYAAGPIGRGQLREGGAVVPIYFRDLFPGRAAVMDELFPDIARKQRKELAGSRKGEKIKGLPRREKAPRIEGRVTEARKRLLGRRGRTIEGPRGAQIPTKRAGRHVARPGRMASLRTENDKKARAWAQKHGMEGRPGGWIYDREGNPVAQGWSGLYLKHKNEIEKDLAPPKAAPHADLERMSVADLRETARKEGVPAENMRLARNKEGLKAIIKANRAEKELPAKKAVAKAVAPVKKAAGPAKKAVPAVPEAEPTDDLSTLSYTGLKRIAQKEGVPAPFPEGEGKGRNDRAKWRAAIRAHRAEKKAAPEGPTIAQLAKEVGIPGDASGLVPARELDLKQGHSRAEVADRIRRDATNLEKSPLDQNSSDPAVNADARKQRADAVAKLRELADRVQGKPKVSKAVGRAKVTTTPPVETKEATMAPKTGLRRTPRLTAEEKTHVLALPHEARPTYTQARREGLTHEQGLRRAREEHAAKQLAREQERVAKAVPSITQKPAAPGEAPSREGRARPGGTIATSKLQRGDRIMLEQGADGEWRPSTRKTSTPVTVDRVEVAQGPTRGSHLRRGAPRRYKIHAHDDQGNEIEVAGTHSGGSAILMEPEGARPRPAGESDLRNRRAEALAAFRDKHVAPEDRAYLERHIQKLRQGTAPAVIKRQLQDHVDGERHQADTARARADNPFKGDNPTELRARAEAHDAEAKRFEGYLSHWDEAGFDKIKPEKPTITKKATEAAPSAPEAPAVPAKKALRAAKKAAPEAAPEAAPVKPRITKKAAAPAEEKFLPPLKDGTRRKSATNVKVGDLVRGPSGSKGGLEVPSRVTKIERNENGYIDVHREDGSVLKSLSPQSAVWMGEEKKGGAPEVPGGTKKEEAAVAEAAREAAPVKAAAKKAAKKATPEVKATEAGTAEEAPPVELERPAMTLAEARQKTALDAARNHEVQGPEGLVSRNIIRKLEAKETSPQIAAREADAAEQRFREDAKRVRAMAGRGKGDVSKEVDHREKLADAYKNLAERIRASQESVYLERYRQGRTPLQPRLARVGPGRGEGPFEFSHGDMHTRLESPPVPDETGDTWVHGDVVDGAGKIVGGFRYRLRPHDKSVHMDMIALDKQHQGTGFSHNFIAHAEQKLRDQGYTHFSVDPAFKGGAFWARQGYGWDHSRGGLGDVPTRMVDRLIQDPNGPDAPQLHRWLDAFGNEDKKKWPTPKEIVESGPLGKSIMDGASWRGAKDFSPARSKAQPMIGRIGGGEVRLSPAGNLVKFRREVMKGNAPDLSGLNDKELADLHDLIRTNPKRHSSDSAISAAIEKELGSRRPAPAKAGAIRKALAEKKLTPAAAPSVEAQPAKPARRATVPELMKQARELGIPGRSKMKRDELEAAIAQHKQEKVTPTPPVRSLDYIARRAGVYSPNKEDQNLLDYLQEKADGKSTIFKGNDIGRPLTQPELADEIDDIINNPHTGLKVQRTAASERGDTEKALEIARRMTRFRMLATRLRSGRDVAVKPPEVAPAKKAVKAAVPETAPRPMSKTAELAGLRLEAGKRGIRNRSKMDIPALRKAIEEHDKNGPAAPAVKKAVKKVAPEAPKDTRTPAQKAADTRARNDAERRAARHRDLMAELDQEREALRKRNEQRRAEMTPEQRAAEDKLHEEMKARQQKRTQERVAFNEERRIIGLDDKIRHDNLRQALVDSHGQAARARVLEGIDQHFKGKSTQFKTPMSVWRGIARGLGIRGLDRSNNEEIKKHILDHFAEADLARQEDLRSRKAVTKDRLHETDTIRRLIGAARNDRHRLAMGSLEHEPRSDRGGDLLGEHLAAEQGFDRLPEVISHAEFERRKKDMGLVLYRGVNTTGRAEPGMGGEFKGKPATEVHDEFRYGRYHMGLGSFGNGTYMTRNSQHAKGYSDLTPGSVARYGLRKDAKIVELPDLIKEYDAYHKGLPKDSPESELYSDLGRFAMGRGYDAIHVPRGSEALGTGPEGAKDQYVILNRGKVIAEAPEGEHIPGFRAAKKAVAKAVPAQAAPEAPVVPAKKAVRAVKKAAPTAAAPRHTTPEVPSLTGEARGHGVVAGKMSDKPIIPNTWGDFGAGQIGFHPDSETGQAIQGLGADRKLNVDGEPLENVLGKLATDLERGKITTREHLAKIKALRDRMPEGSLARRKLDELDHHLDASVMGVHYFDTVPKPIQDLANAYGQIPIAAHNRRGVSGETPMERLTQIAKDFADGKTGGGRMIDDIRRLRSSRHESFEGHREIETETDKAVAELEAMRKANPRSLYPPSPETRHGNPEAPHPQHVTARTRPEHLAPTTEARATQVANAQKRLTARQTGNRISRAMGAADVAYDLYQLYHARRNNGDMETFRRGLQQRLAPHPHAISPRDHEVLGAEELKHKLNISGPGSPDELDTRLREQLKKMGIDVHGHTGDRVPYDPETMSHTAVEGGNLHKGDMVEIRTPGLTHTDQDGKVRTLKLATVQRARSIGQPRLARKAVPKEPAAPAAERPVPRKRISVPRKGSTIGEVERGPTVFEEAMGVAPTVKEPEGDFQNRAYGPAILHRGEALPEGFDSRLQDIRKGQYTQRPGLTADESKALDQYTLSRVADPMNNGLREGKTSDLGKAEVAGQEVNLDEVSHNLDSAIQHGELAHDTRLYRGTLMRSADIAKLQKGAITREDGYLSTTTDNGHAYDIIGWRKGKDTGGRTPVVFEILAPKGTHAAAGHTQEKELVLGRGRRMRVIHILSGRGFPRHITVELLPEEHQQPPAKKAVRAAKKVAAPVAKKAVPSFSMPEGIDQAAVTRLRDRLTNKTPEPYQFRQAEHQVAFDGPDSVKRLTKGMDPVAVQRVAREVDHDNAFRHFIGMQRPEEPTDPYADLPPVTPEEYKKVKDRAESVLRDEFHEKPVAVRVGSDGLEGLLRDGRLKNAFESGRSGSLGGASKRYLDHRRDTEQMLFGIPKDAKAEDRPIYGFVGVDGFHPTGEFGRRNQYGRIDVVLRPDVRGRTTVSEGDTLDTDVLPSPMEHPTIGSFNGSLRTHTTGEDAWKPVDWQKTFTSPEAQIHGGVTRDDVAGVIFHGDAPEKLTKQLDEAGIPYKVLHDGDKPLGTDVFGAGAPSKPQITKAAPKAAKKAIPQSPEKPKISKAHAASAKQVKPTIRKAAVPKVEEKPLEKMTKAELTKMLPEGRKIPSRSTKAQLISMVRDHQGQGQHHATMDEHITALRDVAVRRLKSRKSFDSSMGQVDLVQTGTKKAIRKQVNDHITPGYRITAKEQTDSENLMSRMARAFGIGEAPAVYQQGDHTVYMDHVGGKLAAQSTEEEIRQAVESPEGRRLALLDLISGETDRNDNNWKIVKTADGRLVPAPLDNSLAFRSELRRYRGRGATKEIRPSANAPYDRFINHYGGVTGTTDANGAPNLDEQWATSHAFSRAELQDARSKLVKLEPEFRQLGREDWHQEALDRLDALIKRAPERGRGAPSAPVPAKAVRRRQPMLAHVTPSDHARAYAARSDAVGELSKEKTISTPKVLSSEGNSSDVELLEKESGKFLVHKSYNQDWRTKGNKQRNLDAEELGTEAVNAMGMQVAAVHPGSEPGTMDVEFIRGRHVPSSSFIASSDQGKLYGLSLYLSGNDDANDGNWMIADGGRFVSFDHAGAFTALSANDHDLREVSGSNYFMEHLSHPGVPTLADKVDWNPTDLAIIRSRLEALKPKFEAKGRLDWWETMMKRLALVEERADPSAKRRL